MCATLGYKPIGSSVACFRSVCVDIGLAVIIVRINMASKYRVEDLVWNSRFRLLNLTSTDVHIIHFPRREVRDFFCPNCVWIKLKLLANFLSATGYRSPLEFS